jgi:hypothetical protein
VPPPEAGNGVLWNESGSGGDTQIADPRLQMLAQNRKMLDGAATPVIKTLRKLADIEELNLVSFEFGDDVVSRLKKARKTAAAAQSSSATEAAIVPASFVEQVAEASETEIPRDGAGNAPPETIVAPSSGLALGEAVPVEDGNHSWLSYVGWTASAGSIATLSVIYRQRLWSRVSRLRHLLGR